MLLPDQRGCSGRDLVVAVAGNARMSGRAHCARPVALGRPDLADARWFPVDLHVPRQEFSFLPIDQSVLERSPFLDTRMDAPLADAVVVPVDAAAQATMPVAPLAWLFHTSFCCSTLLAGALHIPSREVVLREPLVLRRLGDARHARWPLEGLVAPTVRLLCRPWSAGGTVVVKPTHAALNIATALLDASPGSRGVLLTSSLEDFLISNLKKSAATLAKAPALAERALLAGSFRERLPSVALSPPDLLSAAALQWAAQRELSVEIVAAAGPHRLRVLDAAAVTDDLAAVAWQCARWMQLPAPQDELSQRAAAMSAFNAKAPDVPYDSARRAAEMQVVRKRCGSELTSALKWFERAVLPAMSADALAMTENPWRDR